ncbi:MAG: fumarylacetoacetate hydrolase family protein [Actinobacteria bacterium]|nr:fumarylacetoacetate hydrolase family protein [Actinomycetota bacterium]
MRLATIRTGGGSTRAVRIEGAHAIELDFDDVGALLASGAEGARLPAAGAEHDVDELDFAPLVLRPRKIICLGLNYRSHILETGRELPTHPTLFAKYDDALVGARSDIELPVEVERPDWEVELAFVIGRTARRVRGDEAADAIAGYTICNDVSMRDWQYRTLQWLQGKTWERSTPLGPFLVSPDEVDDAADLRLRCEVDGEVMQDGRTSDLLFKPRDIVEYVSTIVTLRPGDVVSTGTPAGIGDARDPRISLRSGQVVGCTIDGLGEQRNRCVRNP